MTSKGPDGTPEDTARKYGFAEVADFMAQLRLDPAKVLGKKKSSKSMKKKINSSGRSNTTSGQDDDGGDSSRGSATESTGTDGGDEVTATKSKPSVDTTVVPKDAIRKSKKANRSSKPDINAAANSGYATETSAKPARAHGPRRVASAIHHPMVQENPSPAKVRSKRSSSGGAATTASQEEVASPRTTESQEVPVENHHLETVTEQSSESPSLTPAPSAVDIRALDTIASESEGGSEAIDAKLDVKPDVKPEPAPTGQGENLPSPRSGPVPVAAADYDEDDIAYSDIVSPRTTASAPPLFSTYRSSNPRKVAAVAAAADDDEEFIPFGPRRIQQHSTGVRQQKNNSPNPRENSDRAKRGRSIKIESLLTFFESKGGDVRGGTLPTKSGSASNTPLNSPHSSKKPSRQLSGENGTPRGQLSPRNEGGMGSPPGTPARNPPSRNTSGGPSDSATLVSNASRGQSKDSIKPPTQHQQPQQSQSSPTLSRAADARRATVGDVNQIRQLFTAQGMSFEQALAQQGLPSPRQLAMSGAGSSEEEQRKKKPLQGGNHDGKNSSPRSPREQTAPSASPAATSVATAGSVPSLPVDHRPNEPLSGSSSPRTPGNRSSNSVIDKAAPRTVNSASSDDSESDSKRTTNSGRTKGSLSGSKDDSTINRSPEKPMPLKKGGSKDTILSASKHAKQVHASRPMRVDSGRLYGFKQLQPSVSSSSVSVVATKSTDVARAIPFSSPLARLNFESLLAVPDAKSPAQLNKAYKDDIVVANAEFSGEFGRSGEKPSNTTTLFAEDTEFTTPHYWDNFFAKEADATIPNPDEVSQAVKCALPHFNFVGTLEGGNAATSGEPVIVSCIQKGDMILGLLRTRAGDATFHLEWPAEKKAQHKTVLRLVVDNSPQLKDARLTAVKDAELITELLSYERVEKNQFRRISQHKIGILYVKEGQTTEEAVLGNRSGSDRFEEFLKFLGKKVELQGYDGFDGGLDTKKDRCGKHSIMARWLEFEIMFHVSTYIPLGTDEEKLIARKKYIGNDMTCLVFLDTKTTKFEPPIISGDFLHNFVVVKPDHADPDSFTVNVAVRQGVPSFGPPLPKAGQFKRSEQFHDWLLSKLVNAERATLSSTQFVSKFRLARSRLLGSLVDSYKNQK